MKKIFILFVLFALIGVQNPAFCAKHDKKTHKVGWKMKECKKTRMLAEQISLLRHEIEALEKGPKKRQREQLNQWLNQLETKLQEKIQKSETRLVKYQEQLSLSQGSENAETMEEDTEATLGKISTSEQTIQTCRELLKTLEQLKAKIS